MPLLAFGKRFVICNLPVTGPLLTRVFRDKPGLLALMRSTLAVTQAEGAPAPNILPHTAVGMVNARLLPGDDPQELLERMQALVADLPVRVELARDGGGCDVSSPDSEGYRLLEGALHEAFPQMPVIPTLATGAMDCRWYAPMSDCALRFTPIVRGDKENAGVHGIDEALSEQTLGLAVEVYMTLMRRL